VDAAVDDPLVGRLVDGRYRIRARIARGGMATVYEAADQRLGRDVALKVMHPDLAEDRDFVARFITEARASASLSRHRTIVTVFDQGASDGLVWIALERVHGRTLRRVLAERGRLDQSTALAVAEQVLTALAAAHAAGIVHRDVKPENVLVGDDGHVQVADFGLAHAVAASSNPQRGLTTRGLMLGTVAYISPEQAQGQPASPRSDVYAAGVMLSEMLTGHPPHQGATDYLTVTKHVQEDVCPPSAEVDGVAPEVDRLVTTATARDPQGRYPDAAAFLAAVRAARVGLGDDTPAAAVLAPPTDDDPGHVEVASALGVLVGTSAGAARTADTDPIHHSTAALAPLAGPPGAAPVGAAPGSGAAPAAGATGGDVERTDPPNGADGLADLPADPFASPAPTPRRRRWGRRLLLVGLVAAALAGLWWWVDGRMVPAPSLVGMTVEQAQATAQAAGLATAQVGEAFSETVPAGAVASTDPAAGARIAPGDTIALVLSRGPERYSVPDLRGQTQEQAAASLSALTLVPGTVGEAYDEQVPAGQVVSQDPAPGAEVRRETPVSFVLSLGREPIGVPAVAGQGRDEAIAAVEAAGLVAQVSEQYSTDVARGVVISQQPAEGTLFRGDPVALVVSLGPETVQVPRVEGQDAGDAKATLEAAGLTVRRVELLPAGPNQVLRQAPAAGQTVKVGSEVTIYVF
jgi:serine/threonine-protein kinase